MKASIITLFAAATAVSATFGIETSLKMGEYPVEAPSYPVDTPSYPVEEPTYPVEPAHPVETPAYPVEEPTYPVEEPTYPVEPTHPVEASSYPVETESKTEYPVTKSAEYPATTPYITSVYTETQTSTILSCPPEVTDCPVGKKTTTEVVKTTICPATETEHPVYPTDKPAGSDYPVAPVHPAPSGSDYPVAPVYPVDSGKPEPVLSTATISTCVPTVIYKTVTVAPSAPAETYVPVAPVAPGAPGSPYGTGAPVYPTGAPVPPKNNGTLPYEGAASAQRVGGLFVAVLGAAALLF